MSNPTIHAEIRTEKGKGVARTLRRAGRMPAVAYGGGNDAQVLSIEPSALQELKSGPLGWNQPVKIEVAGGDTVALAMLKAVDKHPISGAFLHADFLTLDAKQAVKVEVPLRLVGTAPGVALGGLLNQQLRTLTVSCLPGDIPAGIALDVSKLEVGDRLLLSELKMPKGVAAMIADQPLVSVSGRRGSRLDEEGDEAEGGEAEGGEAEGGEAEGGESGE
jgi:large subunit ribosomal protein L25